MQQRERFGKKAQEFTLDWSANIVEGSPESTKVPTPCFEGLEKRKNNVCETETLWGSFTDRVCILWRVPTGLCKVLGLQCNKTRGNYQMGQ
jgi:hypothetical protein